MANVTVWANVTTQLLIKGVTPPAVAGDRWQYYLEKWNGTAWEDACDNPTPIMPPFVPDSDPVDAIAMTGSWDANGQYLAGPGNVIFSCHAGVAAKCTKWGYPFDGSWPTVTENGNTLSPAVTGADMLQVCSRMARADYCGVGITNTLTGTPIYIDDVFHYSGVESGYDFEAAWKGTAQRRTPQGALCLTKKRWSTLPLGGNCPLTLPDPRVNASAGGAFYCTDKTASQLEMLGARTYSASTWIDAGLWNYRNPATGYRLATTFLQPQTASSAEWIGLANPGVGFPVGGQTMTLEATIFNTAFPAITNVPGAMKLFSYKCGSGVGAVTTTSNISGCSTIATEGFVYPDHTTGRAQMRRWVDGSGNSYTTTASPATMIASQYTLAELTGSVIRSHHAVNVRWSNVPGATYDVEVQTQPTGGWSSCSAGLTAPSLTLSGQCSSFSVDRNDITGFRVTAHVGAQTYTNNIAYDGIATDVHVDLASFLPTALAISWTNLGARDKYFITIDGRRCFDVPIVGTDLSRVATNTCPSLNSSLTLSTIGKVTVCGTDGLTQTCATATYDGVSSSIAINFKK